MQMDCGISLRGRQARCLGGCARIAATCLLATLVVAPAALTASGDSVRPTQQQPKTAPAAAETAPRNATTGGLSGGVWYALGGAILGGVAGLFLLQLASRRATSARQAEDESADVVSRITAYAQTREVAEADRRATPRVKVLPAGNRGAAGEAPEAAHEAASTMEPRRNGHVLLAPADDGGYELFEVGGGAPSVGEVVDGAELGLEGRFSVASIGPSPLDGDLRDCAYLVRID